MLCIPSLSIREDHFPYRETILAGKDQIAGFAAGAHLFGAKVTSTDGETAGADTISSQALSSTFAVFEVAEE